MTNDDGIDAPGMAALETVAASIADEIWVVAPTEDQSGISHAVTLHHPLRAEPRGERRYGVSGTPSDCVALGISTLMAGAAPDLILSGINRGANIADDVAYSGTVGAAVTGTLLGFRAAALSQAYSRDAPVKWHTAIALAPDILTQLFADPMHPRDACLNINFPDCVPEDVEGLAFARQGRGTIEGITATARTDLRGTSYYWMSFARGRPGCEPGSDAAALRDRRIAVTPIGAERTHQEALRTLQLQRLK